MWAMRTWLIGLMVGVAAPLVFTAVPAAQGSGTGYTNTVYDKLNLGPGGPAPSHELTGVWAGPIGGQAGEKPSFTELGKQLFDAHKPEATYKVAHQRSLLPDVRSHGVSAQHAV